MAESRRAATYDDYWRTRNEERTRARSRERALAAVALLRQVGRSTGRLLEVGCGPGWALEVFRECGFEVAGVDASPLAVARAAEKELRVLEIDVEAASVGDIQAVGGGALAVVAAMELLEHVAFPLDVLRKLGESVEPGGHLLVSLPNEIHIVARFGVLLGRLPFGGHDDPHLRHFDRQRAGDLLAASGLRVIASRPQSIAPSRYRIVRGLLAPWVGLLPGLFSLSEVYLLEGSRVRND